MRLRAQLALALFLLAVVPLGGVTVYAYLQSLRVYRAAVETETRALAEGMGTRMEAVAAELDRRIQALRQRTHASWSRAFEEARRKALTAAEVAETRQVLENVLAQARRGPGDIPFAVDRNQRLYTPDASDLTQLQKLGLPGSTAASLTMGEGGWVVASRRDPVSGLTLGVARPLGATVRDIRRTAVRNLGYGLAMVVVALLGILPLSARMTRNLEALTRGAERLAGGDLGTRVSVTSRDEFGQLAEAFNRMAAELRLNQERMLEQERLRKELEMCRLIQEELLPRAGLPFGFGEVKGVSIPAREVGGDFFNYFPLDRSQVALLVGDVSGKGVPAALLMANLQATLRGRLPVEDDLARLATRLDEEIHASTPPQAYLTLFMAVLDGPSGLLRWVNAGHNTQFLIRRDGELEDLESTGRPLGLWPGGGYEERRAVVEAGDSLFLFTDGLVEAEDESGAPFGSEHLRGLLLRERQAPLEDLLRRVEQAVRSHRGRGEPSDDATMVALRVSGRAG